MNAPIRWIRAASLPCVLALTAGCAFGTRNAELSYPPRETDLGPATAHAAPAPPATPIPVVVLGFQDRRADPEHIGQVQNTLGMRTAWVVSGTDVAAWVTDAVETELESAGYKVKRAEAAADSGTTPVISGDVLKVFGSAYLTYGGDVTLDVRVTSAGKEIHRKTYTSHRTAGLNWTASGGGYANALEDALSDDLRALVADLNGLLAKP